MNNEMKEFVINNFINLIKFVNIPYSPEKQKKLYQNHIKDSMKNDKFPDLEIPVITLKKIDSNSDLNKKNITKESKDSKDANLKYTKFNFSADWTMELLKAVLDTMFSGKIDEISEIYKEKDTKSEEKPLKKRKLNELKAVSLFFILI